jgi:hypothetical protein
MISILGPGAQADADLYGLYCDNLDRLVVVYHDYQTINTLAKCMSSKMPLEILCLTGCADWKPDLIDNKVCLHWGLGNSGNYSGMNQFFRKNIRCYTPEKLVDHDSCPEILKPAADLAMIMLAALETLAIMKKTMPDWLYTAWQNQQGVDVLDFFDDDFSQGIKNHIAASYELHDQKMERFEKRLQKMLYWSKTVQEVTDTLRSWKLQQNYLNQIYFEIHKRYLA